MYIHIYIYYLFNTYEKYKVLRSAFGHQFYTSDLGAPLLP